MEAEWPFADPGYAAAFTTQRVFSGERPVLLVTHDLEDGAWQFHDGEPICPEEAIAVALAEIASTDPSLGAVADLPLGWAAWRDGPREPWQRAPARIVDAPEEVCPNCGIRHLPGAPDPEPTLEDDGWSLERVSWHQHYGSLPLTIPDEAARRSLMPGDIARLLFHWRTAEHTTRRQYRWVRVTEAGATGYLGILDDDPVIPGTLEAGDLVCFRPEHVVDIRRD